MSSNARRFWMLGGLLLAVNVAGWAWVKYGWGGAAQKVRILAALPTENTAATDRLVLVFDEPLGRDAQRRAALDRAPFVVHPAIDGRWQWAADDRLEFVLSRPLAPGRRYTLRPTPDLETQFGRTLVGPREFAFEGAPLEVRNIELQASDAQSATIAISFNQAVEPGALLRALRCTPAADHLKDDVQTLECTALTPSPAEQLVVRVPRFDAEKLRIEIDAALTGFNGDLPLRASFEGFLRVAPHFALLGATAWPSRFDVPAGAELRFSQTLDATQAPPKVEIEPPVAELLVRFDYRALHVEGEFQPGQRYTATISGEVRSTGGEVLETPQSVAFEVPDRWPALHFPSSMGVLCPGGNLLIDLEASNVSAIELGAYRVHENNLAAHLHGQEPKATSRELTTRTFDLAAQRNEVSRVAIDLAGLLEAPLGVYRVRAKARDREWTDDSAVITVSDLAITAKREREGALVWITSLLTARPVADAEVTAYSFNNQRLARGVTDVDGLVRLEIPAEPADGPLWLITARSGDDLNFLLPDRGRWTLDGVDQSGRVLAGEYDVLLYAERGVYRPGETVRLTGLIRDRDGRTPPPFPLNVQVVRPDGRVAAELPVAAQRPAETADAAGDTGGFFTAQGFFQTQFASLGDSQTGPYRFRVTLPGDDTILGEATALVEAFVPVRIEVQTAATQPRYAADEKPVVRVAARYLFGQPAADLPVGVTGTLAAVAYESAEHPTFTFGDPSRAFDWRIEPVSAALDADGRAEAPIELPDPQAIRARLGAAGAAGDPAPPRVARWRGDVNITVTEPGGRSVSAAARVLVDAAPRFLGLRLPAGKVAPTDESLTVEWVCVRGDDAPAAIERFDAELFRVEYDNVLESVNGRPTWKSLERLASVAKQQVAAEGEAARGRFSMPLPRDGRYRLLATDPATGVATRIDFDAARNGDAAQVVALDTPERLDLQLDREAYAPGDTAVLLVKSPFAGTLLVTVETDRVITQRVVAMSENTVRLELPVAAELRGGAFVSATVVRAVDPADATWLPHRALGLVRLTTSHEAASLPLTLTAPARAEPGETVRVRVQLGDAAAAGDAYAHVWAVDEGVLLTTDYETPDPLKHFFAPRAAQVATADVLGDLLPDNARPADMQRIGAGDDGDDAYAARRGSTPQPARPAVVIWRGIVPLDAEGRAEVEAQLPEFTGELRWMAVAVAGDRYGSTRSALTVTAPLLAELSLPRAVAVGDSFEAPLKLFNTGDAALEVAVELRTDGPLSVGPLSAAPTIIPPGEARTLWLSATAENLGEARVAVTAAAADVRPARALAAVQIRPIGPLHSESQLARVSAGEPLELPPPDGFLPGTGRTTVSISPRPSVDLRTTVDRLMDYPYGCVEQTASQMFALLHAPELIRAADKTGSGGGEARAAAAGDLVRAGIARLWSMQTRCGGLSYWPGDATPYLWGSTYAATLLARAKRAGYEVDPRFAGDLVAYLSAALERDATELTDDDRAEICAALAAFDQPALGWMATLSGRLERLDLAGRAHLASAWLAAGRRDRALAVLPEDTMAISVTATTGGRLTSPVQQDSVLLGALLDIDPAHPWAAPLAQRIMAARQDGAWRNTLENAQALAALVRYQSLGGESPAFEGVLTTAAGGQYTFSSDAVAVFDVGELGSPLNVHTRGAGAVYVAMTTEGVRADSAVEPYDRRLRVRRSWQDVGGQPLNAGAMRVGDLIAVEVTIVCEGLDEDAQIENVAIVDRLPGGVEVENPRLATSAVSKDEVDVPDRAEFLDDRVVLFTPVGGKMRTYRYLLRATTAGVFANPAIEASCMYDPAFASVHGGGTVEVKR